MHRKRPDHPRIRGEHLTLLSNLRLHLGSSPHTRGAQPRCVVVGRPERIIPAYAGSTSPYRSRGACRKDHPRIRGEHTPHPRRPSQTTGSSPHTRGALEAEADRLQEARIIPAYAGSTALSELLPDDVRDHPRIRGEHYDFDVWCWNSCGSSPHTRGALRPAPHSALSPRIIPAYAGSTSVGCPPMVAPADHPRIRGEHPRL